MAPIKLGVAKHRKLRRDLREHCLRALGSIVAPSAYGGHLDLVVVDCNDSRVRLIAPWDEGAAVDQTEGQFRVEEKSGAPFITASNEVSDEIPELVTSDGDCSKIYMVPSSSSLRDDVIKCLRKSTNCITFVRMVKNFAHRIMEAEELSRLMSHTFRAASSGIPGISVQSGNFA